MGWKSVYIDWHSTIDDAGDMGRVMLLWPLAICMNVGYFVITVVFGSFTYIPKGVIWLCDNSKFWVNEWRRKRIIAQEKERS